VLQHVEQMPIPGWPSVIGPGQASSTTIVRVGPRHFRPGPNMPLCQGELGHQASFGLRRIVDFQILFELQKWFKSSSNFRNSQKIYPMFKIHETTSVIHLNS
jgi:hypothetical protein